MTLLLPMSIRFMMSHTQNDSMAIFSQLSNVMSVFNQLGQKLTRKTCCESISYSTPRPVYTQLQIWVRFFFWKIFFVFVIEKFKYFLFSATDQRQEQQYWQYAEDLETENTTMLGSDFYLDRNTCSLTALALSPSVLFHFILFSVKIIRK